MPRPAIAEEYARECAHGQQADQVRESAKALTPAFARRLQTRLKELLNGTGTSLLVGQESRRCLQSAATSAKNSIRLRSHLQHFAKASRRPGESGTKEIGFSVARRCTAEANTMLSKTLASS